MLHLPGLHILFCVPPLHLCFLFLRATPGFIYKNGEIDLPDNIVKGIKYYDKIKDNIPRETIDEVYDFLTKTLLEIDKNLFGIVCVKICVIWSFLLTRFSVTGI